MRGKGIKELSSNRRGSQLVNLQVSIPKYVFAYHSLAWESLQLMRSVCCRRTLTPRQEELMEEFLKEENERAVKGESDCKSHTFANTVRETVDRIKNFIKSKTAEA